MNDSEPNDHGIRAVTVVGPSDAGKTTLVEGLVERLSDDYAVATVKSIHHRIEPDDPGTDTHRHRTAGADAAVGITPDYAFEVSPLGRDPRSSATRATATRGEVDARKRLALYDALGRFAARGFDLVIIEGFADAPLPSIRVGDVDERDSVGETIATDADDRETILAAVRDVAPAVPESTTDSAGKSERADVGRRDGSCSSSTDRTGRHGAGSRSPRSDGV